MWNIGDGAWRKLIIGHFGQWSQLLWLLRAFVLPPDGDDAGEKAAAYWLGLVGNKGKRIPPPDGKDVTDYWKAGGDLRSWVAVHTARPRPLFRSSPKRYAS